MSGAKVLKIGRHTFSDPDVVALVEASGGCDPYVSVKQRACELISKLDGFESGVLKPLERMCILASLAGFEVKPMDSTLGGKEAQDAIVVTALEPGQKGMILYNLNRPGSRTIHSIAHEIGHSFFPTSSLGASYRSGCQDGSREGRELELLCDRAAAELTMPEGEFRLAVQRIGFGMRHVDETRATFGTSFEACLYRMATTADFPAAAGLACFRGRQSERRLLRSAPCNGKGKPEIRRYRRQSFHVSAAYPPELLMPWNKSFPEACCIYEAAKTGWRKEVQETIALGEREVLCHIEALQAPYQRSGSDHNWPDVLFLLRFQENSHCARAMTKLV